MSKELAESTNEQIPGELDIDKIASDTVSLLKDCQDILLMKRAELKIVAYMMDSLADSLYNLSPVSDNLVNFLDHYNRIQTVVFCRFGTALKEYWKHVEANSMRPEDPSLCPECLEEEMKFVPSVQDTVYLSGRSVQDMWRMSEYIFNTMGKNKDGAKQYMASFCDWKEVIDRLDTLMKQIVEKTLETQSEIMCYKIESVSH